MSIAPIDKPRIDFDVHHYYLSPAEETMLRDETDVLARQVEDFPAAELHVLIEGNAPNNDVSVELSLVLPEGTLVACDHDTVPEPAFVRGLKTLIENLQAYKEGMHDTLGNHPALR